MSIPEENQSIDLKNNLVDLADYRKADRIADSNPDPLIVHVAYAQDDLVYDEGKIISVTPETYREFKQSRSNDLVNKFGLAYASGVPLLLHKKLADVLVDVAIDLRDRRGHFTVVMDALRTYDSALKLQESRPDLVESGLLTKAGNSAHNRALAVDSKLFELADKNLSTSTPTRTLPLSALVEVDEHGHLDDLDMTANSRFYQGAMSDKAHHNRLVRLQAWQRASIKHQLPIANLLSEFWDDRVTGSPADMWRVLSCRAMCLGISGDPKINPTIHSLKTDLDVLHAQNKQGALSRQEFAERAYHYFVSAWEQVFSKQIQLQLNAVLGRGAGAAPALSDFMFHEWLNDIYDRDLANADFPRQSRPDPRDLFFSNKENTADLKQIIPDTITQKTLAANPLRSLFESAKNRLTKE